MSRRAAIAVALLAGASCAGRFLFGQQADRILFPHARHLKEGIDCSTCHDKLYDAKKLGESGVLPSEATCLQCHQDDKDKGKCGMCHSDPEHPLSYFREDRHLEMNHASHLERVKEDCRYCHQVLPEPHETFEPPKMATCMTCHNHQVDYENGRCEVCHEDLTRYPLQPITGTFSHGDDWVKRRHMTAARSTTAACQKCHDQTYCSNCHDAQTVPIPVETRYPEKVNDDFQIHRGDWLSRHSMEALADRTMCARCHGPSFCTSCHTAQNLTPAGGNPRNPHPPGWAFPGPTSHATAARDDIGSCQSCHDQGPASDCIQCHKVGGIGGNPHPASFLARHTSTEIRRNAMCLYCHR